MIRLHIVVLLALAQSIFAERLIVHLATGGRGVIMISSLLDPWLTLALVVLPFFSDLRKALWTPTFAKYWMPFLGLTFILPVFGVMFMNYPFRTIYASWNAIIPFTFLIIGCAGGMYSQGAEKTLKRYLLFAVFAQMGLAAIQAMGQFEYLPGFLRTIYDWDFQFKVLNLPDNVILGRSTGFYLNPNSLGIWALLAFWTSFLLLDGKQKVIGAAGSFITILLCQSRGTMAAFLGSSTVYGLVWMLMRANREERLRGTLVLVVGLMPLLFFTIPGVADSLLSPLQNVPVVGRAIKSYTSGAKVVTEGAAADANFKGRTEYWVTAGEYLAEHPFGSLGSPELMIGVPPDNQYVAVAEQGSFYYFIALMLVFIRGVMLMNSPQVHARLLAVTSLALMINGISAVPFAYPAAFMYWLLVGVYLARQIVDQPQGLDQAEPGANHA